MIQPSPTKRDLIRYSIESILEKEETDIKVRLLV